MMRRIVLFFVSIDGQILQSVLICIDLHGSIAAERLITREYQLYLLCGLL